MTSIGRGAFAGWDIPEVISMIKKPFIIRNVFSTNTYMNVTLYVPAGTIDKYKATLDWNRFVFIEEQK